MVDNTNKTIQTLTNRVRALFDTNTFVDFDSVLVSDSGLEVRCSYTDAAAADFIQSDAYSMEIEDSVDDVLSDLFGDDWTWSALAANDVVSFDGVIDLAVERLDEMFAREYLPFHESTVSDDLTAAVESLVLWVGENPMITKFVITGEVDWFTGVNRFVREQIAAVSE